MIRLSYAAALVVVHELLRHAQKDPAHLLVRNLPQFVQVFLRSHMKPVADAGLDALLFMLAPVMVPRHLRCIRPDQVSYGSRPSQSMSVFKPVHAENAPVLLFVHGGVWTLGHREQYHSLGQRFAYEGFVAVIVGYRTWPECSAAMQAVDVGTAVTFVTTHAGALGIDACRVYLSGQSSGANVAALALLNGTRCEGFIGMCGPYDLVAHLEYERRRGVEVASMMGVAASPLAESSPTLLIGPERPFGCKRVLLLHGELDSTVPISSSALFAMGLLAAAGHLAYQVQLVALPTDNHMSFLVDLALGRRCELLEAMKDFCGLRRSRL